MANSGQQTTNSVKRLPGINELISEGPMDVGEEGRAHNPLQSVASPLINTGNVHLVRDQLPPFIN